MEQHIDLSFLKTFTGGDSTKIKKYINMFTGAAQGMLAQIESDCKSSDWTALKTSSHTIKTQLKYMGAEKAQTLAFEIEQLSAKADDTSQLPALVAQLIDICGNVLKELKEEVEKL
jgi:HPt (histidine-containing phosphotransfer) domain-containing protein